MSEDRSSHDPSDKSWIEKIAQAFSGEPKTRGDLIEILKIAQQNEIIDSEAQSIIEGALEVSDQQVREVLVPRPQMVVVKSSDSPETILTTVIQAGHSRFPVIGETLDDVLGILLAKDLLPLVLKQNLAEFDLLQTVRPATFVPESKRLNVLLREFRERRNHMAVVIDEYGGVSGLITIEDVLEEIVGEIEDEYDSDNDVFIKKLADNDYIIKALTPIDDFNDHFSSRLNDDEFDTIGGLLMKSFGHVPQRNEETVIEGFSFKVLNADNRRIHLLRMSATD
jgi:magnesium and cobalt transporter